MKIKERATKICETYAQLVKTEPDLRYRMCAKVWAFSDIGILTIPEAIKFVDMIIDNASEAERRNKRNECN